MSQRKNVVVFYTDQQRADSLGCMGNPLARTPNLDALAARGVRYTRHYAANPVCMPSRAAFITGRYPQANGVIDNGIHLPEREVTLPEVFRRAGYRTAAFGKLHFQNFKPTENDTSYESYGRWNPGTLADWDRRTDGPAQPTCELDGWDGPYYGFERVALAACHGEAASGHYGRWRQRHFPDLKLGPDHAQGRPVFRQFASWKSNLPLAAHHSTWVADRAIEFLEGIGDQPFFIFVGFPDPHHPFTPPAPYHSLFDGVTFPEPHAAPGENESKPKPYRDAMTGNPFPTDGGARYHPDLAGAAYQQIAAHTCGMVTLIDHSVGRVLTKLTELGLAEDTVVVFTADHGEFLGDHWFLNKGQLPSRSLLNIPLIISDPAGARGVVDAPCSNVDVMPTLLSLCGIPAPAGVQGVILPQPGQAPRRPYAFEAGWSKASPEYHHFSLYTADWHIAVFPNLRDGELYDLRADPWEHRNLYHDPACREIKRDLLEELLYAVGQAEPPRPPVLTDW